MTRPKPRTKAPDLDVETLDGAPWRLRERQPGTFSMIVFYRGLHCPRCQGYLRDLDRRVEDFAAHGVDVIAVSGDDKDRARRAQQEWGLEKVPIAYGQSIASMREWGLFISRSIKDSEPAEFGEPGLFLVRPDGTVYYEAVNSMPFGRPQFGELLQAIDFVTQNDYPARGEA